MAKHKGGLSKGFELGPKQPGLGKIPAALGGGGGVSKPGAAKIAAGQKGWPAPSGPAKTVPAKAPIAASPLPKGAKNPSVTTAKEGFK